MPASLANNRSVARQVTLTAIALVALVLVAKWGANLVMWLTLLMAVLSWVNPRATAMPILQHLLDPLLRPIRLRCRCQLHGPPLRW